ncbi:MAG: porphobilinogen synthase [Candidatus Omnitrophica bacterium]|nr:porphobilinogen synthase [Candidatus Omnitrophota bacterium]
MKYPELRLRRLREHFALRKILTEHTLLKKDLIQPLFVKEGLVKPAEITSMPGQWQWTENTAADEARRLEALGIPGIILFGIPSKKDKTGKAAFSANGIIQKTVRLIKKKCPKLLVITDVCLCEYMSHGHCGILKKRESGKWRVESGSVDNDATVRLLAKIALSHARAGADVVAPSDMMDGRVAAIRSVLDKNHFKRVPIISYAVKYASSFYAPFREAAQSAPSFGDRASYQMNPANAAEAIREADTDLKEGADMILVKPALGYSDIIFRIKNKFHCPVGAYSVSGEYALIKAASQKGWIDAKKMVLETHLGLKRAGANFIITYWAKDIAEWLEDTCHSE